MTTITRNQLRTNRRFVLTSALAGVLMLGSLIFSPAILRATSSCLASSPPSNAYTANICIDDPADGSNVADVVQVNASISVVGTNPGVSRFIFYLDNQELLTDVQSPYGFELPTTRWIDGSHVLGVVAVMRDGFTTPATTVGLTFSNNITQIPPNTRMFTPAPGTTPLPEQDFTLAAVGDGASGEANSGRVTDLIASWNPNMFLYLGDVYEKGLSTEFYNWYGTSSRFFGRFRAITNPTIGNHEYDNGTALGYFDYWDNVPNYYSFNANGWHFISINSDSHFNQTNVGTPQYNWLVQDLNANSATCTVAYWHHPRFSVGPQGDSPFMQPIWTLLSQNGVDIVLSGHDHSYQRWNALDDAGNPSSNGITTFVAGSGGHGIQGFVRTDSRLVTGFDTSPNGFGALRMQLNVHGAGFQFINLQGLTLDSGSVKCSGAPNDTTPPTAPSNLTAHSNSISTVSLSWSPGRDNVGVTGYDVYRDGTLLTTTGALTTYEDNTVVGLTTYEYQIRTRDAAGNVSPLSTAVNVTTPDVLFRDDFETGDLSEWANLGLAVQQEEVYGGAFAARGTSTGQATYAQKGLSSTLSEAYYSVKFKVVSRGANAVYLLKFRTPTNLPMLGLLISPTGKLQYRNDVTGITVNSTTNVSQGSWHEVQVRLRPAGAAGEVEVWLDGLRLADLSNTESLGTDPVGGIYLGENTSGRFYDIAFDDVAIGPNFIAPIVMATPTSSPTSTSTTPTSTRTRTSTRTPTVATSPTSTGNPTNTVETATSTSTSLPTFTPTQEIPTQTATPTWTHTATSTSTSTSTATNTATYTPTATNTVTNTATNTVTNTATRTVIPTSTRVTSFTFTTVADAYVNQSKPTSNYGDKSNLRLDASASKVMRSYLRFQVQGLPAPRTRATLMLFSSTTSATGYQVRSVANNTWLESTINYNNSPPVGGVLGSSGAITTGTWKSVDVTSFITGGGTFNLALTTSSTSPIDLVSREGGANAPKLVVEIAP